MDSITQEALTGLSAAIASLVPQPSDPKLKPIISVQPLSVSPAGLGGFVGINDNPVGEIVGRRIDAVVVVAVNAPANGIDAALAAAITAVLAADRATLLNLGLLRVALTTVGERGPGPQSSIQQPVTFRVLYEYLKLPVDPEGIIKEIPLNIQLQQ